MFDIRLAPMCGITDHVYRTICYEQGCDLAYTEMISAMGYLCAPKQRATQELMIRGPQEPLLILQLFGRDPETVAEAVLEAQAELAVMVEPEEWQVLEQDAAEKIFL